MSEAARLLNDTVQPLQRHARKLAVADTEKHKRAVPTSELLAAYFSSPEYAV
jgi:hypothetical protein